MAKQYDNSNSGALFKNAKKVDESQPDYTGECEVGGVKHRISAWLKTSKAGKKYMSLAFMLAQETYREGVRHDPEGATDESIPF